MLATFMLVSSFTSLAMGQAYNYTKGGKDWTGLCKFGKFQSPIPINFDRAVLAPYSSLGVIEVNFFPTKPAGNWTQQGLCFFGNFGSATFNTPDTYYSGNVTILCLFAPSQHYLNGKQYDLEVTFVSLPPSWNEYFSYTTTYLFEVGSEDNVFIDQVLNTTKGVKNQTISLTNLVQSPNIDTFYNYLGSNPQPPCNEVANWHVIPKIQQLSKKQLTVFQDHWAKNNAFAKGHGSNRDLQKIHGRDITFYRGL